MKPRAILDTGPWVAVLAARDAYHPWAREALGALPVPLLTCEAVVAETCYLLGSRRGLAMEMLSDGLVQIAFRLEDHVKPVHALMAKYADVPISFADACLVRMAELGGGPVVTLDRDFLVYRAHRRRRIPLLSPPA